MSLINKKGIVKVSKALIQDEEGLFMLGSLMSEFTPIIIQETLTQRIYHGFSESFKEIQDGDLIPVYEAKFSFANNHDKIWDLTFEVVK